MSGLAIRLAIFKLSADLSNSEAERNAGPKDSFGNFRKVSKTPYPCILVKYP